MNKKDIEYFATGDSFVFINHGYIDIERLYNIQNTDKKINIKEVEISGFHLGTDITDYIEHIEKIELSEELQHIDLISLKLISVNSAPIIVETYKDQLVYRITNIDNEDRIDTCKIENLIPGDYILVQGGKMQISSYSINDYNKQLYNIKTKNNIPSLYINKIIYVNSQREESGFFQ